MEHFGVELHVMRLSLLATAESGPASWHGESSCMIGIASSGSRGLTTKAQKSWGGRYPRFVNVMRWDSFVTAFQEIAMFGWLDFANVVPKLVGRALFLICRALLFGTCDY